MVPPNGLPLSCAALIDRESYCVLPTVKKGTILRTRSGVSYSGVLGGGWLRRFGMRLFQVTYDVLSCRFDCPLRIPESSGAVLS